MTTLATTRHTEATRKAILDAAVDLFMERRGDDFSIQEVADRAGLTHRTVYRYYSTRQELIGATAQHVLPGTASDPFSGVSTVEEWIEAVSDHLAFTEKNFEFMRSIIVASLASDDIRLFGQSLHDRDTRLWEVFRHQFSRISEDDARRTFAMLRHLTSSTSYILVRLRFGFSPADAVEAIRSSALQVVEQAAYRNRAGRQRSRR